MRFGPTVPAVSNPNPSKLRQLETGGLDPLSAAAHQNLAQAKRGHREHFRFGVSGLHAVAGFRALRFGLEKIAPDARGCKARVTHEIAKVFRA